MLTITDTVTGKTERHEGIAGPQAYRLAKAVGCDDAQADTVLSAVMYWTPATIEVTDGEVVAVRVVGAF